MPRGPWSRPRPVDFPAGPAISRLRHPGKPVVSYSAGMRTFTRIIRFEAPKTGRETWPFVLETVECSAQIQRRVAASKLVEVSNT